VSVRLILRSERYKYSFWETCSQTGFETLPIFYNFAAFVITFLHMIERCALALGTSKTALIPSIEIDDGELVKLIE
jgi:hypothetical protein